MFFEMFDQKTQPIVSGIFWKSGPRIVFEKNFIIDQRRAEPIRRRLRILNFCPSDHDRSERQHCDGEKQQGLSVISVDHFREKISM